MEAPGVEDVRVSFIDDGATAPVELVVTEQLAAALARAAEAGRDAPDGFPVSFTTLFLGLAANEDGVGHWLYERLEGTGLHDLLARRKLTARDFAALRASRIAIRGPLRRTRSARTALDEGDRLVRDRGLGPLDTRHVVAAYLALPTYHVDDFRALHIDRAAWAAQLARAMAAEHPEENWPDIIASAFPSAGEVPPRPPQPAPPPAGAQPADDVDVVLAASTSEPWVLDALAEASALAGDDVIRPSHVLQAIVDVAGADASPAFARFAALSGLTARPRAYRATPPPTTTRDRIDPDLYRQLAIAQRPATADAARQRTFGRDLVTAALLANDEAGPLLASAGRALADLRDSWFGFVTSSGDHRSVDGWKAWWREAGVALPAAQLTGVALETSDGVDRLGIDREAQAFARLILDRKVDAPLSIGLLGDWGSGKSFFIRQIKDQIRAIKDSPRPELYSNPVEIDFNAWHVSDANLWASLVTHIFDEIWENVSPEGDVSAAEARRKLLARIETARGAVHEAEAEVAAREKAVEAATKELAAKRQKLAWHAYVTSVEEEELRALAHQAGFDRPLETIGEVRAASRELAGAGQRVGSAIDALARRPVLHVGVPVFVTATLIAVLWLFLRDGSRAAALVRWTGSAAAAIGMLVAPLELGTRKLTALARTLEQIRDGYDAAYDKLLPEKQAELQRTERELVAAEDNVARAREQLAALISEHAALEPQRRLGSFLQDRVQSTVYRSQQGIISLVHKDFEKLSEIMRDLRAATPGKTDGVAPPPIKPLDRIILYVDDLDRCRPAQVVQMLEAVHLLLALDLFIVVVAVDSRWLERALEVHYHELLSADVGVDSHDVRASTPHNYLEKIFQVTYALGPMDPVHFKEYVRSLAGVAEPTAPVTAEAAAVAGAATTTTSTTTPGAQPASTGGPGTGVAATPTTAASAVAARKQELARTPVVRITDEEQQLICTLVPLLPTPRIAKRMVNVYRLVKASMDATERARFDDDRRRESCLLMLAILFGRPAVARELLRELQERTAPFDDAGRTLVAAIEARKAPAGESPAETNEWKRLAATLTTMKLTTTVGACRREPLAVARYSLVTGHEWHTWTRWADAPPRAALVGGSTPPATGATPAKPRSSSRRREPAPT